MTDHAELNRDTLLKVYAQVPSIVLYVGTDRTIRYINRTEIGYGPADVLGEPAVGGVVVTRDVTDRHRLEEEARKLRGLVPVCSWCKKVRSDAGFWEELEAYIERLGADRVTHGICPECEREVAEDDGLDDSA